VPESVAPENGADARRIREVLRLAIRLPKPTLRPSMIVVLFLCMAKRCGLTTGGGIMDPPVAPLRMGDDVTYSFADEGGSHDACDNRC
jgi:hypothetical protein